MPIDLRKVREYLKDFAFKPLFIEALGWDRWSATLGSYAGLTLTPIAEKSGFAVIQCTAPDGNIPSSGVRAQIDKHLSAQYEEHIVIFVDGVQQSSLWRWVKKESGKRGKPKEHDYRRTQPGDSLIQRLAGIAFDFENLDAEGRVAIGEVSRRVGEAFDTERGEWATLKLVVTPLVLWLWIAGAIMALGTLYILWPSPQPQRERAAGGAADPGAGWAVLVGVAAPRPQRPALGAGGEGRPRLRLAAAEALPRRVG